MKVRLFLQCTGWVFDRIGLYDESLVRNQDDELYFRLRKAGGKFYITPKIEYVYFVRENSINCSANIIKYSFWRIPVMLKHRQPTTLRQVVPSLFYIAMVRRDDTRGRLFASARG